MDESERKLIEQEILNVKAQEDGVLAEKQLKKTGIVLDSVPKAVEEKTKSRILNKIPPTTRKDDLKKCIIDMCAELGEPRPKSTFFRKTKAVLEDKVQELTKKLEEKAFNQGIDKKRRMEMLEHPEKNPAAVTLYNLNYIASQTFESISIAAKEKTFNIAVLEGFCDGITKKRDQFLRVFARLTEEHGEIINKYLSPVTEYALLMLATAAPVIKDNIKKKKKSSDEKSTDSADNIEQH